MLEYCVGGDLAGYIQRYGRVSQAVARHFMRQLGVYHCCKFYVFTWSEVAWNVYFVSLVSTIVVVYKVLMCVRFFMACSASGLQVLRENNLIHRDLKPQVEIRPSFMDTCFFLGAICYLC